MRSTLICNWNKTMALLTSARKYHRNQFTLLRRNGGVVIVLWLGACAAGFVWAFVGTSNSDPARLAFAQAETSSVALHNLGYPLRRSYLAFGDLETHGSKGEASVSLTVYGPRGRGTLYADAVRLNRNWQLISLDLAIAGHPSRLNLMPIQSTVPR